jgi:2-polyprenyl-3-methyl-5-hydroxy-6-metoxy-1,4-benzoquinol methylase
VAAQPEITASYSLVDLQSSVQSELVQLDSKVLTREQYNMYYRSGAYDRRYPVPNYATLLEIKTKITSANRVLDFGCGSGRYSIALAPCCRSLVAYDPSPEAIRLLKSRIEDHDNVSHALELEDVLRTAPYDVAICIFGVLSHMTDIQHRMSTLEFLRKCIRVGGWLVVSVPNRMRRFYRQQLMSALQQKDFSGRIDYHRGCVDRLMPYFLYTERTLRDELHGCGFLIESIKPESIMPETFVTKYRYASALENRFLSKLPPWLGYGMLATARRR